jgi:hypothetical protein
VGVPPPASVSPPSAIPDPTPAASTPSAGAGVDPPVPGPKGPVAEARARGLCHDWRAASAKKHGKPMAVDSRRELAAMAGGDSRIADFCAPYLPTPSAAPEPTPEVTTSPSRPGRGKGNGNGNGNGNGDGGPKGGIGGKPGGNNTANAVVDGRAGTPD